MLKLTKNRKIIIIIIIFIILFLIIFLHLYFFKIKNNSSSQSPQSPQYSIQSLQSPQSSQSPQSPQSTQSTQFPQSSMQNTIPKQTGKTNIYNNNNTTIDHVIRNEIPGIIYNTDINNNTPDIKNVINVDLTKLIPMWNYSTNTSPWGFVIIIDKNTIYHNYYFTVTEIDVKNNLLYFNPPSNFNLNSSEAWSLTVNLTSGPTPSVINK